MPLIIYIVKKRMNKVLWLDMQVYAYSPSIREAEAGESRVRGQPRLFLQL